MWRLPPAAELGDVAAKGAARALFGGTLLSGQRGASHGEQQGASNQSRREGLLETLCGSGLVSMAGGNGVR